MILVTGATGLVGRCLVHLLVADGQKVRAVTRDVRSAAGLPPEADVAVADPTRPETLGEALTGVAAVFLQPRAVGTAAGRLLELARERGARRVVALSAINVDDDLDWQPSRLQGDRNKEAEEAAATSGLPWVSLRAGTFADNARRAWAGQLRAGDVVRYPYPAFAESPVHERDLAEVAVRALHGDDPVARRGRRLSLTGPESLRHVEMVAILGEVLGRPLRYEEIPPEAVIRAMTANGIPEAFVTGLMARYARELPYPAPLTGEVERVLGRPALTFAEWAADHAADFTG